MNATIHYNRTTNHIDFGTVRTGAGQNVMNRCGSVTRGNLAKGRTFEGLDDLKYYVDHNARKLCKNCLKALEAEIASEQAYQARLAASLMPATEGDDLGGFEPGAPAVVSTVVLPHNVTMDPATRILSGQFRAMKSLMDCGLALMTEDGDLVLR